MSLEWAKTRMSRWGMREADVEGAVCQGCNEKLEFQGKEHLWLLRERTQRVSWGEGGVRCMAGDTASALCKHLCTSTAETQTSMEWGNGKAKPRYDQYPESTLRWFEAPLESGGLMINVEKKHTRMAALLPLCHQACCPWDLQVTACSHSDLAHFKHRNTPQPDT